MEINKDVERENIHTVSSSVVPQKFKNKITYDPEIPLVGIHPKELKTWT